MNFEYIQSFLAVCEHKSISQASHSLFISQPTLTNRLKKLEDYLNVTLFKRSWEGIELTEQGALFLPHALKMLDKLQDFKSISDQAKDIYSDVFAESLSEKKACFNIGMNNYLVPLYAKQIIKLFVNEYPGVHFKIITGSTKVLLQKLHYGLLDQIIYYHTDTSSHNTSIIKKEEMVIIVHPDDYEAINNDYRLLEKLNKPLYLNSNPTFNKYFPLFESFYKLVNNTQITIIENLNLIRELIYYHQGYAILPESVYDYEFKQYGLKKVFFPSSISYLPILSTYTDNHPKTVEFSDRIENTLTNETTQTN